jgi:iron complex outermembrane recepter protein
LACSVATAQDRGRVIEEMIVTAEKRETAAQETSVAISVFDPNTLQAKGIDGIEDLQFAAPNLVISHNAQSPVTYAYIRGIGSDQLVAGFDPGVAYHVDGVYVGQPSSMPADLWDMERIEVLRGPQGTLHGRNTTGGAINVITAQPRDQFGAVVDLTSGNYERRRVRAAVTGPLSDGIAGRLSFISDRDDGFQRNLTGKNGDRTDFYAARGKLRFDFSDDVELTLTAQRMQNDGNQSQKKREPFGPVELAPGFVLNVYEGAIPNPTNPRVVAKDHPETLDLTNTFGTARLGWNFDLGALGPVQLVAISGYIKNEWFQSSDIDMSNNPVQYQLWNMETRQLSQELQLVSQGTGPWQWIVGAFYFTEDLATDYVFEDVSIAGFFFNNGGDLDTTSRAVFGQVSYDMRDRGSPLRVTAGLRWTQDEKTIDEFMRIPTFGVDLAAPMSAKWDEWSGKLGVDWFIGNDAMAYASYSRGYKGGGFSIGQFDRFEPETVDAIELGVKSQFLQNRAQVNVAAFYNDYRDLQVNFLEFTSFTTDNAAEATIRGIEVETIFYPTDALSLFANATWLDATFDEYQFSESISLDGQRMNRAPKYATMLAAQYDFSLGNWGTLSARADYYWQDSVYYRVQNIPRHRADDYYTVDTRMTWTSVDDLWTVDAFVKNVTDQDNQRGLTVSDGLSTGNNSFVSYHPPRTYGVRFARHFGSSAGVSP